MALQGFQLKGPPTIGSAWLNQVDILKETVFGAPTTKAGARANLTSDAAFEVANGGTGARSIAAGWQAYNPQTADELTASVTPINYFYRERDIRRYALLDGTDATTGIQNWAKLGGVLSWPVAKTALISAEIPLVSNTTMLFAKGAAITTATVDIAHFRATSKANIYIQGAKFIRTVLGTAARTAAAVTFDTCTDCFVDSCEFTGMQWSGVYLLASSRCSITKNYFHDFLGNIQDAADIAIESSSGGGTSGYNYVDGNQCYGGLEFGISCWDPYSGVLPTNNVISNNRIGAHKGYGILCYMPDSGDSYNQFIGNKIDSISAFSGNTDSGAGIYVTGAGAGGTVIANNTIRNCCITTSTTSLAPGGIGVNGTSAGTAPISITGNTIDGMTKYHGIILTGCLGGASVGSNSIRQPAANITGHGITVVNSNNIALTGNTITQLNTTTTQRGILLFAQGANNTNISVTGNTVNGGHQSQIETTQTSSFLNIGIVISGNVLQNGDASCVPLLLGNLSISSALVTGNYVQATTALAVSQVGCLNVRYSNNIVKSGGSSVVSFTGTNTGTYFDKTNTGTGVGAGVTNSGTGAIIEIFNNAAPTVGSWAVGDRVEQSIPIVGNPKGWRCTVAGSPGTWVSEGNL